MKAGVILDQNFGSSEKLEIETLPRIVTYEPKVLLLQNRICWVRTENWSGPKYLFIFTDNNKKYDIIPPIKSNVIISPEKAGPFEIIKRGLRFKYSFVPIAVLKHDTGTSGLLIESIP